MLSNMPIERIPLIFIAVGMALIAVLWWASRD